MLNVETLHATSLNKKKSLLINAANILSINKKFYIKPQKQLEPELLNVETLHARSLNKKKSLLINVANIL